MITERFQAAKSMMTQYQLWGQTPLGGYTYFFEYSKFQHDRYPLAIIFAYEEKHNTFLGVNLHYFHPTARIAFMNNVHESRLVKNQRFTFSIQQLAGMVSQPSLFVRRYKYEHMHHVRFIPYIDLLTTYLLSQGIMNRVYEQQLYASSLATTTLAAKKNTTHQPDISRWIQIGTENR